MKLSAILSIAFICVLIFSCDQKRTRVACIGDSITEGYGLKNEGKTSYPVVLDSLLGPSYVVFNFGRSATTLQKKGNFPYWVTKELSNAFHFQPDIIVIKLGSNDTKPYNWNAQNYESDYQSLIDTLRTMESDPEIFLCYPVPVYMTNWGINDSTVLLGIIPAIDRVAAKNDLPIIDLYHPMQHQPGNFPDGIHPNEQGAFNMAVIVAEAIR
jgi:alpha-L-fucosidase 2